MPEQSPETRTPWQACVLSLYPQMFPGPLGLSLSGRALEAGLWALDAVNIRDFATDRHASVDGTPAGGGPGMVMRADVVAAAIDAARGRHPGLPLIHLSPRGKPLTQERVRGLSAGPGALLLCGRFEGIDQRVLDARQAEEISIGDYVLSGGELPAMVLIEACVRLLPGVIGERASLADESFETGLLEYPQYTRPRVWEGREIPEVLFSGDHKRIAQWRREQALALTRARRPDLISDKDS
ncbi:MAG: tRNA (guanosine(37)-N1)-methyltransferase TrmD [Dichotomicrobium sp.]